jgi:succinyl-CoA synthetase beta subunit
MGTIIIDQVFIDEKYTKFILRKEVKSDLVPAVGMDVEEIVWEKTKKIKKVNINIDKNCYVIFIEDEFVTKSSANKILDNYKKNGWKEI